MKRKEQKMWVSELGELFVFFLKLFIQAISTSIIAANFLFSEQQREQQLLKKLLDEELRRVSQTLKFRL